MLIKTYSSTLQGLSAITITIEVYLGKGINFFLVGLPDNAVKESHQRIKAAFKNNSLKFPGREITINMAPADLKKEGSVFDLPIAIGILAVSNQISAQYLSDYLIVGELSLDGTIQPCQGLLSRAIQAKKEGFKGIIVPALNYEEVRMLEGINIIPVHSLIDVLKFLQKKEYSVPLRNSNKKNENKDSLDFKDVKGQTHAKRAFEIAAAGGHNLLLIGPPGAGKSMLAKRMPSILPPLSLHEAIETTSIHSIAFRQGTIAGLIKNRPFRAPHHTISDVALVGGGTTPKPGEISMAHNGILFLDELPEFKRNALEVLRQPLEEGAVSISRANMATEFPANFTLIAAMNPCPCGHATDPNKSCECSSYSVQRYRSKISGPLLDRIDMHVQVSSIPLIELQSSKTEETSSDIKKRVLRARKIQEKRFNNSGPILCNTNLSPPQINTFCSLPKDARNLLENAMNKLNFSARSYHRILKVSRTIADLEGSPGILSNHVAEALHYRCLDRGN